MKYMTKKESKKVKKLSEQLRKFLSDLGAKYYDEEAFGPTRELYAKDYEELLELQDELTWWLG